MVATARTLSPRMARIAAKREATNQERANTFAVARDAYLDGKPELAKQVIAASPKGLTRTQYKQIARMLVDAKRPTEAMTLLTSVMGQESAKHELAPTPSAKVGDILVAHWGYDQTNIDYYQVVAVVGTSSVRIRAIRGQCIERQTGTDLMMPVLDGFLPAENASRRDEPGYGPEAFVALLKSTDHSICQDETRFHLNGTLLEGDGRTMRAVTTDGHRLTRATAPIKGFTLAKGVILPRKASREISKLLSKGECELAVVGHFLFVKQGPWTLAAKLIDAQFPPYEQVIPKEQRKLVTVEREPLLAAIERAKLVSTETRGVKLSCDDGQLRIQSDNPDTGEASEWLPAEHHGKTIVVGFNARYLIETLNELDGERVTLGIGAELDPILVRATDDVVTNALDESPFLSVVMPMRI